MLLRDKNIVITGSGRGIGKYIALACAEEGANIGLTSRTLEELNNVKREIESLGTNVKVSIKTGDITEYKDVENVFKQFYCELGLLNGVIANAGWRDSQPSLSYNFEVFRRILDINILGVYFTFRASYPYLKKDDKQDKARFIITGSTHYYSRTPLYLPYTIAKYGVVGMMNSLSSEFKKENVTFNMVLPRRVDTKLTRGENIENGNKPDSYMNPWDLNDYYLFLLSEYANKYNYKLLNSFDFEHVKQFIFEAPEEVSNLDSFLEYLKEKAPKTFRNVKDLKKIVQFLLIRNKK